MRLLLALLVAAALGAALAAASEDKVVRIEAKRFEFVPAAVTLKKGERVVLELVTLDRTHGFKVPGLGIGAPIAPGETTRITIVPEQAGRFPFLCDNFCGDGHDDMDGVIVVTE
jgi:cytochrome c oxidase subunit 2